MTMDATNDMPVRRVTTLTELARDVPPSRDLWPGIAAAIEAERTTHTAEPRRRSSWRLGVGIAASVALVAIGALLGRALPTEGPALASNGPAAAAAALLPAVAQDARHAAAREELLREADAKLAELPPQDRERVVASLAAIRRSVQEIEAALGREPANALLQELLVNAYQDEMRVLTVLAEARQEI